MFKLIRVSSKWSFTLYVTSIAATSLQQLCFCCPMGGCFREVALYIFKAVGWREVEMRGGTQPF